MQRDIETNQRRTEEALVFGNPGRALLSFQDKVSNLQHGNESDRQDLP